jgi:hypothetical protein
MLWLLLLFLLLFLLLSVVMLLLSLLLLQLVCCVYCCRCCPVVAVVFVILFPFFLSVLSDPFAPCVLTLLLVVLKLQQPLVQPAVVAAPGVVYANPGVVYQPVYQQPPVVMMQPAPGQPYGYPPQQVSRGSSWSFLRLPCSC